MDTITNLEDDDFRSVIRWADNVHVAVTCSGALFVAEASMAFAGLFNVE